LAHFKARDKHSKIKPSLDPSKGEKRKIFELEKSGKLCLKCILKLASISGDNDRDFGVEDSKLTHEEDMVRQVKGVLASVSISIPLSVFGNIYLCNYLKSLDPQHSPPHYLKVNQIIECTLMLQ
jgi:hypothetical protein